MGFTELVVDKKCGDLNEVQEEYLKDVLQSSEHLLSLINDILDLSKVEAGKLKYSPGDISLEILLENSLGMVKEKATKQGIKLHYDPKSIPEFIRADERKLKQIMYNLLSNAVKFTPDGGSITLSACQLSAVNGRLKKKDGREIILPLIDEQWLLTHENLVEISVKDTGIGLNREDLERIFKPFEQADNSPSRKYQGTGLGLSLTKKFVELHGGKIWAESMGEGEGSVFRFIIPIA